MWSQQELAKVTWNLVFRGQARFPRETLQLRLKRQIGSCLNSWGNTAEIQLKYSDWWINNAPDCTCLKGRCHMPCLSKHATGIQQDWKNDVQKKPATPPMFLHVVHIQRSAFPTVYRMSQYSDTIEHGWLLIYNWAPRVCCLWADSSSSLYIWLLLINRRK